MSLFLAFDYQLYFIYLPMFKVKYFLPKVFLSILHLKNVYFFLQMLSQMLPAKW